MALEQADIDRITLMINEKVAAIEIPDVKDKPSKKYVTDTVTEHVGALKTSVMEEVSKTNEAVNKIAKETETKIAALDTKKSSGFFDW